MDSFSNLNESLSAPSNVKNLTTLHMFLEGMSYSMVPSLVPTITLEFEEENEFASTEVIVEFKVIFSDNLREYMSFASFGFRFSNYEYED